MFHTTLEDIKKIVKPENFVGRAPQQVSEFIENEVSPIIKSHPNIENIHVEVNV